MLGDYSGMQRFGQNIGGLSQTIQQQMAIKRNRAMKQKIAQIYQSGVDPETGQIPKANRPRIMAQLYQISPEMAQKQGTFWLQEEKLAQSGKGETQGPAGQVVIDNKTGQPYLASRDPKDPRLIPLTLEGQTQPTFKKEGKVIPDEAGKQYYKAPGSEELTPLVTPGGQQVTDPGVLKGKAETGIKYSELELKKLEEKRKAEAAERTKTELVEKHKKTAMKFEGQLKDIDRFIKVAEDISEHPGLEWITGPKALKGLSAKAPGTPAADANAKLEQLLAMGAIQSMAKLKAESPTGATGFGALSAKELKVIEDSFSALENKDQSPKQMRDNLREIVDRMNAYKETIKKYESEMGIVYRKGAPKTSVDLKSKYGF